MRKNQYKRPSTDEGEAPMLKMKELMEASGETKATILHYVKEGLLPEPVKTSRNMAYYHESCIERIQFIKQLQFKHQLPLSSIKAVLHRRDEGREVMSLIEMQEVLFESSGMATIDRFGLDKNKFCKATGLAPNEVDKCLKIGLLVPRVEDVFDHADKVIGDMLRRALDMGLTLDDLAFYSRLAKKIVNEEMDIHERFTRGVNFEKFIAVTLELIRIVRPIREYVIERNFGSQALSQRPFKDTQ